MSDCVDIVLLGAGTAGSAIGTALADSQLAIGRLTVVDRANVQEKSLITSPAFGKADIGKPKSVALAEALIDRRNTLNVIPVVGDVEDVDWQELLRAAKTVFCLGLDNWESRLATVAALFGKSFGNLRLVSTPFSLRTTRSAYTACSDAPEVTD